MEMNNATIEYTALGFEGHGILTAMIHVDFGDGGHQGFGGYALGKEHTDYWVRGLLETLELEKWEDLKGAHVRIKREEGWNGRIKEIGHFLKDKWFSPLNAV
jgi:hypothetical protein